MTTAELIAALDLPSAARVDQRVPKKLLVEHGAPTAADKRRISEGIEELHWVASVKPNTIGVPEYRDESRTYLEIAVLEVSFRAKANVARLVEVIHRAIPYPVVLCAEGGAEPTMSLAHKRWSQAAAGETVIDGPVVVATFLGGSPAGVSRAFLDAVALSRQAKGNLFTLFQGWIDAVQAYMAAQITGSFALPRSTASAETRRQGLVEHARLEGEIGHLRSLAGKERQLTRRVDFNLAIKRLEAEDAAIVRDL